MLFVLGGYLLFACSKPHPVATRLLEAEALMDYAPDSSLVILQQIEAPEELPAKEYALWCLLYTQAKEKNYIDHTSDSLVQVAIHWFKKKNDRKNLMKAYYHAGAIWQELEDAPRAQQYYLKALETGEDSKEHAILGRIYANLGSIYIYQDLFDAALRFQEKAIEHFTILKDTTATGYALRNIGRIHTKMNQLDSALIYYSKALECASGINYATIHNDIGVVHKKAGNYQEALKHIKLAISTFGMDKETTPVYSNLGDLYRLAGDRDSAYYYLSRCLDSPNIYTKSNTYLSLSYLEEEQENWPAYAMYQNLYRPLQDSLKQIERADKLLRVQNFYNYQQAEREKNFYKLDTAKKSLIIYRLLAILFLTFLLLAGVIAYHRKDKRRQREQQETAMRFSEHQKYIQFQKGPQKEKKDKILPLSLNPVFLKFMTEGIKVNENDWYELETEIEKYFPGFTHKLKILLPTIDTSNLRLCYLLKINMPVKQIAPPALPDHPRSFPEKTTSV